MDLEQLARIREYLALQRKTIDELQPDLFENLLPDRNQLYDDIEYLLSELSVYELQNSVISRFYYFASRHKEDMSNYLEQEQRYIEEIGKVLSMQKDARGRMKNKNGRKNIRR